MTDTSYTADALNRYTAISGTLAESTLAHDADGNLTQDGTWTYTYDGENRLQNMSKSGQTLTFTYDYLGRRIRKVVTGTGARLHLNIGPGKNNIHIPIDPRSWFE